jgi:pyruvate carboxylase
LETGKTLNIQMMAKGEQRADGQREVFMELNGQSRSMLVRDNAVSKVGAP